METRQLIHPTKNCKNSLADPRQIVHIQSVINYFFCLYCKHIIVIKTVLIKMIKIMLLVHTLSVILVRYSVVEIISWVYRKTMITILSNLTKYWPIIYITALWLRKYSATSQPQCQRIILSIIIIAIFCNKMNFVLLAHH